MEVLLILIFFAYILALFVFIEKRLRNLSDRHIKHTWVKWLRHWYIKLVKFSIILLIILFSIWTYIILKLF